NGVYSKSFEDLAIEPSGCTLSANKTTCTYTWGYCVLNTTYGRMACVNTQGLNNAYVQYFPNGPRENYGRTCWSLSTTKDDKYGKLCERMGAVYKGVVGLTGVVSGGHMYKF
ncbi:MAG: hypothetical protein MJ053_06295, partial [Elusimicrobiaceae bacterium]|nr:hypothetical protein [Elusimicrobiaceae bacterium]